MNKHKYNYGIIGNCSYLALIDTKGNVGWMCWPRFDSSFVFGELLDEDKGGRFSVSPAEDDFETEQRYIPNSKNGLLRIRPRTNRIRCFKKFHRGRQYVKQDNDTALANTLKPEDK